MKARMLLTNYSGFWTQTSGLLGGSSTIW
jgi:hypothetical protein